MPPTSTTDTSAAARSRVDAATDAFLARYVEWREACLELRRTDRQWSTSTSADRRLAFAAHRASLEREAAAADAYGKASEEIRRAKRPRAPSDPAQPAAVRGPRASTAQRGHARKRGRPRREVLARR